MDERYLWDGSGPPDPEIQQLEQALRPLRFRGAPRPLEPRLRAMPARRWKAASAWVVLAAAASALFVIVPARPESVWTVEAQQGGVAWGWQALRNGAQVRSGEEIRTAADGSLVLRAQRFGRVEVGSNSVVRVLGGVGDQSRQRLGLERGEMDVLIWAPPGEFAIETPGARAVDLGCQYTVSVDANGDGLLRVGFGWVAFQFQGRESFVPEGAACSTSKRDGPGLPYFENAPAGFQRAAARFDSDRAANLRVLLTEARPADALTLWHLLSRISLPDRRRVFARFAELIPSAHTVDPGAIDRLDPRALDAAWNAMGLDTADWWRTWKRNWPE